MKTERKIGKKGTSFVVFNKTSGPTNRDSLSGNKTFLPNFFKSYCWGFQGKEDPSSKPLTSKSYLSGKSRISLVWNNTTIVCSEVLKQAILPTIFLHSWQSTTPSVKDLGKPTTDNAENTIWWTIPTGFVTILQLLRRTRTSLSPGRRHWLDVFHYLQADGEPWNQTLASSGKN